MAEESLESVFKPFILREAIAIASDFAVVRGAGKRTWKGFFACVRGHDEAIQRSIKAAALAGSGTKRKAPAVPTQPNKRPRLDRSPSLEQESDLLHGDFFEPPSETVIESTIARMIDRTGNAALRQEICMICAGLKFIAELEPTSIRDIPNQHHLRPQVVHPAHVLVDGMLLHEAAVAKEQTYICLKCKEKLNKDHQPPMALANRMWIGDVPFQLSVLSLPERLLVALHFPAVYMVKLYPKVAGARGWPAEKLAKGLRGNVSSYRLHTNQIADMVSGELPAPPKILAATIGITFVAGKRNIPLSALPEMFRVRRQRVLDALMWLKGNNPLYANIRISQERLRLLPENAVPEEIISNVRYSDDVHGVEREQQGYIPLDAADEALAMDGDEEEQRGDRVVDRDNAEPVVIPMQAHGVLDVRGDSVPDTELTAHAIANLARNIVDQDFNIRRSSDFINEYARRDEQGRRFDGGPDNPNHLLGAFPVLFPYGQGGLEIERQTNVSYENHVRWLLQYSDRRFRKDLHFVFLVFSVLQKRYVCLYAAFHMKRSSFIANKVSFLKLTPADFVKASQEENRKVPISNPVVKTLRKQLTSIRAKVQGTDESRISMRAQIWGMNLWFNPLNVWVTISLPDDNDPVAQVLSGVNIDLDHFIATAGPNREDRLKTIVADPFAAAQFFHLMVRAIFEEMFGIKTSSHAPPERQPGIIGTVNGYIGSVEAQARGSLHLHVLFWLKWAPSAAAMTEALQSEAFRKKTVAFLDRTIRAHIEGTTGEDVLQLPKQSAVGYSRPQDPRLPDYAARRSHAEAEIARAVQTHECKPTTCQRMRNGRIVCKRRAPWPVSAEAWIHPSGEWGPRRVYGKLNAWNPPLLQVTRSNQDIKIVTNGQFTKDITFYITLYIAKKQNQGSNASALLATSLAFQRRTQVTGGDTRDLNKRMIQQCANSLSREQELSGSEVVSYLMGWGDRFISHKFVPIYWDEVAGTLRRHFPMLQHRSALGRTAEQLGQTTPETGKEVSYDASVRLRMENNEFTVKDQLKEYAERGQELENWSFLDFHVKTYDGKLLQRKRRRGDASEALDTTDSRNPEDTIREDNEEEEEGHNEGRRPRGRPPNQRVKYLPQSKRKGCRIVRSDGLEVLPHFVGRWFPRQDDREYYCANILALLKPWRQLQELCDAGNTFDASFNVFMATATARQRRIVDNINYFHECSQAAKRTRDTPPEVLAGTMDLHDQVRREAELEEVNAAPLPLTEADIDIARNDRYAFREFIYGAGAMAVAHGLGIFDPDLVSPVDGISRSIASWEETLQYSQWGERLKSLSKAAALVISNTLSRPTGDEAVAVGPAEVYMEDVIPLPSSPEVRQRSPQQQATLDKLNDEQRRAHDIIEHHLRRTIAGEQQEQLLMIVRGEGGTGKTVLLNAIADTFDFLQVPQWLAKTATTGVAASLVGGVTVHSWASIPVKAADSPYWFETSSMDSVNKRKKNILPARYVNIDECSMLTKKLLAQLSQIIGEVRASDGEGRPTLPFSGMNMILFGDFHQFPPVGDPTNALYCPVNSRTQNEIGAALYQQFTTVVTLTEQIRVVDREWTQLLRRLRTGSCVEADIHMLNSLLLSHPSCQVPDFSTEPWASAVLVTPRHGVRVRWNSSALVKHCRKTGHRLYISQAEDTVGRLEQPLNLLQKIIVAGLPIKQTAKLAERVELAVGMRAMVMMNIATEADLANGTRGEVVDIKLDPREEPADWELERETGGIILQYPPVLVLFKPDDSNYPAFEGLPQGILPIVPIRMGFSIEPMGVTTRIHRRQLAMTGAYSFTDYKSQGQTIQDVLIDLEKPPTGKLTPFSAYVALSRSKGRDHIRLLRGFDPLLFTTHPSLDLDVEDRRLDTLTWETKRLFPLRRP